MFQWPPVGTAENTAALQPPWAWGSAVLRHSLGRTGWHPPAGAAPSWSRTDKQNEGSEKTSFVFYLNSSDSPPSLWYRNSGENLPCLDNRTLDKAAQAQPTPQFCRFFTFSSVKTSQGLWAQSHSWFSPNDFWASQEPKTFHLRWIPSLPFVGGGQGRKGGW